METLSGTATERNDRNFLTDPIMKVFWCAKVHPEYNLSEKTWSSVKDFDTKFWENRYESIRNFENTFLKTEQQL